MIGGPLVRNWVPWKLAGMKPLPQLGGPEIGPPRWSSKTTNPGRFWFSVPSP